MKNVLWLVGEKTVRLFLSVFVSAIIARWLGPADFGTLNYSIAILSILIVISSLGTNRIITRECVMASNAEQEILVSTAFFSRLFFGTIIAILLIGYYLLFDNNRNDQNIITLIIVSSVILTAFDVLDMHKQGRSSFKIISLCRITAFILSSLIRVIFVYNELPLIWFALAVFIEYSLTAILFFVFCVKNNKKRLIRLNYFSTRKFKELLHESWPEMIAGFGAILFMRMDQIMLHYLAGSQDVGIYSAAVRISEAWYFIPVAIVAASFPNIIKMRERDNKKYYSYINCINTFLVTLSICAALTFTFFGEWLILLIYGEQYHQSYQVLVLHSWAAVFLCLGISSGSWLVAEKKLKLNLYRNLFGLFTNLVLNFLLIPQYGAEGAAIATVVGMACAFYLFDAFHPDLRVMFFNKSKSLIPFYMSQEDRKGFIHLFMNK